MKISRLHIDQFAREEFPAVTKKDIAGDDLLFKGGNRSGKTLTFNALLYGLYGPRATFGVAPGRKSTVHFQFDNDDRLERGSGGREYHQGDEIFEKKDADEMVKAEIGPEKLVALQFLHSETDELPLAQLSGDERIAIIRSVVDNEIQDQIEELKEKKEELERDIERITRTEFQPREEELADINVGQFERRVEKIKHLQSLIDSGRLETIKQRLLDNEDIQEQMNDLYDRKRTIEQTLRKKNRQLREEQRYTQQVNSIIIDAIQELTCPVCDHIVTEDTAKSRLQHGRCPQCGRERSLDELKDELKAKVEHADDTVEELESEIEELRDEKEDVENKIDELQAAEPDLSDLNDLVRETLEEHDYDLAAIEQRTQEELEEHQETVAELREKKDQLETEIEEIKANLDDLENTLESTIEQIEELSSESFREIVQSFRTHWSDNYQAIAPDLAVEIELHEDGAVVLPGNEGPRGYSELSTGEIRLLNLSFVYTLAQEATSSEESGHSWECLVLDEPFANIDEETRENAMEFIRESELQFIITTSNEAMETYFDPHQIKSLNRIKIQYTLDDFEELMADD